MIIVRVTRQVKRRTVKSSAIRLIRTGRTPGNFFGTNENQLAAENLVITLWEAVVIK
jgi:hypothetical protein